jgi:uncharacterized protein
MTSEVSVEWHVADACWVHPAVAVRSSLIEGNGLFATGPIPAGTTVARLGGRLVSRPELQAIFDAAARDPAHPYIDCLSIDDGIDLLLAGGELVHYGNHSCDPNLWHVGPFALAARRDIAPGEEIVLDYGTQVDNAHFEMTCRCGSPLCRGKVTGLDWQRPDLQDRYGEHWVPVLLRRIAAATPTPS